MFRSRALSRWRRQLAAVTIADLQAPLCLLLAVVSGSACSDSQPTWDLRGLPAATRTSPQADPGTFTLRLGRSLGDPGGSSSFDAPKIIAAHRGGFLAISDAAHCDIAIADTVSFRVLRRMASCGDGPGELRAVGAMTFVGDTLVAYDLSHRALELFRLDGAFVRRTPFDEDIIGSMASLGDGLVLAAVARPGGGPNLPDSVRLRTQKLLAVVSIADGTVKRWLVTDSRGSLANAAQTSRLVVVCGAEGVNSVYTAVESPWQFEGATFVGSTLKATSHFVVDLPWVGPSRAREGTGFQPSGGRAEPACAAEAVWYRRAHLEPGADGPLLLGGRSEFRGYDGTLLKVAISGERDTLHLVGRGAGLGNSFYRIIGWTDVPRIQEFILERVPGTGSGRRTP